MRQQLVQIACSVLASAALVAPALAQSETASITGVVRDRRGAPQIDALIELLRADSSIVAVAHTDARGVFRLDDLLPGMYQLKATEEAYLPSLRQNLRLMAHHKTIADVTMNTLFDVVQWLPAERRKATEPDDDWQWTLRAETNRPMLRFSDDGPMIVSDSAGPALSRARVVTSGGLRSFGNGGLRHGLEYESSTTSGVRTLVRTSLNATDGLQSGYMVGYENHVADGRVVRVVASYSDMPDLTGGNYGAGRYQAATLRTAETSELSPSLRFEVGNELVAMHLMGAARGTVVSGRPFGALTMHSANTSLSFRAATSRQAQDGGALADDDTLLPAVAQRGGVASLERGLHQEIRLRHETDSGGGFTLAAYHDRITHPVIQGSGYASDADATGGDLLIDPVSGVFRTAAGTFAGYGFSASATYALLSTLALSAEAEEGPALTCSDPTPNANTQTVSDTVHALRSRTTPAWTVAAQGRLQKVGTHWRTSYRWQPENTITAVNSYASHDGEAYLSVLIRQPIRIGRILPGKTQAVFDVRNLLAQGYYPFVTPDGSTLFFAQAERSVSGGIAFTF